MHGPNKQALWKCRLPDDYQEHRGKLMLGTAKDVEHFRRIGCRWMGDGLRVRMPVPDVVQTLFKQSHDVGLFRSSVWPEPKPRSPGPAFGHGSQFNPKATYINTSKELPTNLAPDARGLAPTSELLEAADTEIKAQVTVRVVQAAPERNLDDEIKPTVIAVTVQASEPFFMQGEAIVTKLIRTPYPNSVHCPRYTTAKSVERQLACESHAE